MKSFVILAILALPAPLMALSAWDDDCVPAGESTTVEFTRPAIDDTGMPTTAEWTRSEVWDKDGVTLNDNMGEMTPHPKTANLFTAEISNDGGNMVGPNGHIVEGGTKGSCVEVYAVFYFRYQTVRRGCASGGVHGGVIHIGLENCAETVTWAEGWRRVGYVTTIEVCPC